jgi:hypothetical protein
MVSIRENLDWEKIKQIIENILIEISEFVLRKN